MEYIEIYWTSGSLDEARQISRALVSERLVACAQIVPWIESIFVWNHEVETAQETKVTFKTKKENYDRIKKFIIKNCKYEVPEITFSMLDGGNDEYLNWMQETIQEKEFKES